MRSNIHILGVRGPGEGGFSLLEIMVALALGTILAAIALLDLPAVTASFQRQAGLNDVSFDLDRARAEAIAEGATVIIDIDGSGTSYTYGFDIYPLNDPPAADKIEFTRALPDKVTFSSVENIIYDSRGFLIDDNGDFNSSAITLSYNGTSYCTGTAFPTGYLDITCGGS